MNVRAALLIICFAAAGCESETLDAASAGETQDAGTSTNDSGAIFDAAEPADAAEQPDAIINPDAQIADAEPADATAALVLNPAMLPEATIDQAYRAELTVEGGSGADVSFRITGALPAGLNLISEGPRSAAIAGTPNAPVTSTFVITADEGRLAASRTYTLEVLPPGPEIVTISLPSSYRGLSYRGLLEASAPSGAMLSWSISSGALPAGLSLEGNRSTVEWINGTLDSEGAQNFTVRVEDSRGRFDERAFTIDVGPALPTFEILTSTVHAAIAGLPYHAELTARGGLGVDYTWINAGGALPPGLAIDAAGTPSTSVSGTPSISGAYRAVIRATDSSGSIDFAAIDFNVYDPLSIITTALPEGDAGQVYLASPITGGGAPPLTWSIVQGNLPAGLTLDAAGSINGTPPIPASETFTLRVTDALGYFVDAEYTIVIHPEPIIILTRSLPGVLRGAAYTASIEVSGGTMHTWSIVQGSLPAGLSLSTSGAPGSIGGATTSTRARAEITVRVTDVWGAVAERAFSLLIRDNVAEPALLIGELVADREFGVYYTDLTAPVPPAPIAVHPSRSSSEWRAGALSPDGTRAAFIGDYLTDEQDELFLVDLGGPGAPMRINQPLSIHDDVEDLKWSPDGSQLAFLTSLSGLWIADVSAPVPASPMRVTPPGYVEAFTWAPVGLRLVYVHYVSLDRRRLYSVDTAGAPLPPSIELAPSLRADGASPALIFRPDASIVMFVATSSAAVSPFFYRLYGVDPAGGSPPQLLSSLVLSDLRPKLSPNGASLAFLATGSRGAVDLYSIDLDVSPFNERLVSTGLAGAAT